MMVVRRPETGVATGGRTGEVTWAWGLVFVALRARLGAHVLGGLEPNFSTWARPIPSGPFVYKV